MGLIVPPIGPGSSPTWSPDGSHVAVLSAGAILITEVHSGETRKLPCTACTEIAWSPDGRTFAAIRVDPDGPRLVLVDENTGEARPVPLSGISLAPVGRLGTGLPEPGVPGLCRSTAAAGRMDSPDRRIAACSSSSTSSTTFPADHSRVSGGPAAAVVADVAEHRGPVRDSPTTRGRSSPAGPVRVDVQTMHPDGSTPAHLVSGRDCCTCMGFAPNLAWSPDGSTPGPVIAQSRPSTVSRLDGDGHTVGVRFLPGASGPLSWQPLPAGP